MGSGGLLMSTTIAASPTLGASPKPQRVLPLLWEDEDYEMGESYIHVLTDEILHVCLEEFFSNDSTVRVFSNMNLYYTTPNDPEDKASPYVSPDLMVVRPHTRLPLEVASYRNDVDGPSPLLVAEILSQRSYQQRDLREKMDVYSILGISEYILIDVTGRFLRQKLRLLRLQPDGSWQEFQDSDGGITSRHGFRLVVETDGFLRVIDAATGRKLLRPREGESQKRELERQLREKEQAFDQRIRELEAELARLRQGGQA